MLVITGSGRCGTSVLARFCHNIGYVTGGSWNHANNAGMEDARIVEANNAIERGDITDDVRKYVDTFPRRVFKDPRFLTANVSRFWASRRADLRVIVCVRDMAHVRASVAAADMADKTHLQSVTEHPEQMIASLVELAREQVPIRFVAFPYFLSDFATVRKLLEWGGLVIDPTTAELAWNGLVDHGKVHHK